LRREESRNNKSIDKQTQLRNKEAWDVQYYLKKEIGKGLTRIGYHSASEASKERLN